MEGIWFCFLQGILDDSSLFLFCICWEGRMFSNFFFSDLVSSPITGYFSCLHWASGWGGHNRGELSCWRRGREFFLWISLKKMVSYSLIASMLGADSFVDHLSVLNKVPLHWQISFIWISFKLYTSVLNCYISAAVW